MKKLLLALPLIAGASWAGTTLYSGAQTQPAYNRLLEQLNDSNLFVVKSIEYEAGFTSSTAVTEVRLNDEDDSDTKFYLQHKISHSPVSMVPENARFGAANIVTTLVTDKFDDEETKAILESFEGGEPFVMNTDVAMDGATTSEITVNKFKRVNEGIDFTSDGATINLATTAEGAIKGDGKLHDITVVEEGANSMSMSGSTIDFAYEKINELYLDVDFDMNVDKVRVTNPDVSERPLFELQNAFYEIEQKLDNDNPFFKQNLGVKSLVSDFVPLRSLDFNTEFDGFSMDYILENTDTFKKLKTPEDFEDWLGSDEFVEALRAIFTPDSALKLNANAETIDGGGDAAIKLWFVGNGSDDGYTGMSTTGDLAKAFKGTAKATVDRSALMSTPLGQMLNEPIAQIYLKITDDTVSVDATLEDLLLNLNGQILPLEVMGGEAFQMPLEALRDI